MREMGMRVDMVLGIVVVLMLSSLLEAQLQVEFYKKRCPRAEDIVMSEVNKGLQKNAGLAAAIVRMHFHDCFVRGCDGSVLIDSTTKNTAEKDSPINNPSLRGFELIDKAKTKVEAECAGVVSCSDILAFAARDSIAWTGGTTYQVPSGRRDGRISLISDTFTNLPSPTFNLSQLTQNFANKGLTQEEMVTLSGSHTIGFSHCTSISERLYNFSSTGSQDPSLDPIYSAKLKLQCPKGSTDTTLVVPMDPRSPNSMDTSYYNNIIRKRSLFTSDQTLISDSKTMSMVKQNAANSQLWKYKFADAMVKMGKIGVLTGEAGEIRLNCRVIN